MTSIQSVKKMGVDKKIKSGCRQFAQIAIAVYSIGITYNTSRFSYGMTICYIVCLECCLYCHAKCKINISIIIRSYSRFYFGFQYSI